MSIYKFTYANQNDPNGIAHNSLLRKIYDRTFCYLLGLLRIRTSSIHLVQRIPTRWLFKTSVRSNFDPSVSKIHEKLIHQSMNSPMFESESRNLIPGLMVSSLSFYNTKSCNTLINKCKYNIDTASLLIILLPRVQSKSWKISKIIRWP